MERTMSRRYLTSALLRDIESRLSERDKAVIKRVFDLRFVSGSQLSRLHFAEANARAARRALLRLTRLDVLARLPRQVGGVRSGSAGFIYHLGIAGQRLAVERGWQPERSRRRSHLPGTLFLNHSLQVAELHTLLVEADRSRRVELLELAAEPACWRSYGGTHGQRCTLKPDSYVRLGAGAYEDSYFIEVDMGTEGSRALERKLRDYLAYEASGIEQAARGVFPKTLWLAPDAERAKAIEDCIARLLRSARELFAVALFTDAVRAVSTHPMSNEHRTPA
jgi:hypothetical protein